MHPLRSTSSCTWEHTSGCSRPELRSSAPSGSTRSERSRPGRSTGHKPEAPHRPAGRPGRKRPDHTQDRTRPDRKPEPHTQERHRPAGKPEHTAERSESEEPESHRGKPDGSMWPEHRGCKLACSRQSDADRCTSSGSRACRSPDGSILAGSSACSHSSCQPHSDRPKPRSPCPRGPAWRSRDSTTS
jgi:hypothetical protein